MEQDVYSAMHFPSSISDSVFTEKSGALDWVEP